MSWKTYVEKKNAETYTLPKHWDSREKIAEELECSPDRVKDNLRPGLRSGEIQEQAFVVWDDQLKRKIKVIAYCETRKLKDAVAPTAPTTTKPDAAKAIALKKEGKTYAEIGAVLGITGDAARGLIRRA